MPTLVHMGVAIHAGEEYECSDCGCEFIIPEDRDLPSECPNCGCEFG